MKTIKATLLVLVVSLVTLQTGCRTAPIYNVQEAPIITTRKVTLEDVQNAIVRAGAGLGWEMRPVDRGHILGTLHLRSHTAVVDVLYDTKTYNINYKDSVNLKYSAGQIHKNYNGWIQNLDRAIKTQLSTL